MFAAAAATGAAILACAVHGTLKKVSAARTIERTVCRDGLWQAQTPQVFGRDMLLAAYAGDVGGVTDDAQLIESAGHAVAVVPGHPSNLKITTQQDLVLAEAILRARPAEAD